jgi:hypothetical protein
MRAFTLVSSLLFGALVLAHAARIAVEGWSMLGQPAFLATTLIASGMAAWGAVLLAGRSRP